MFTTTIFEGMSFSPDKQDFEAGMEGVVGRLEDALLCIKPLVMDPLFYPFTRPVLYGKQEDLAFKVCIVRNYQLVTLCLKIYIYRVKRIYLVAIHICITEKNYKLYTLHICFSMVPL